ncbi:pre-mRNA cleavage complex II protein Clp1 [Cordyceps fumosorosea ARSEF 2679]|uniref:Polynucleotide 5'-hydroxyl-kinase GRC3 n=1 Tax=Cordyceps fumosorosea (strain ARSEF 2679) TaxID=1081104 RepID=A0A167NZ63_CORFA|nr:pre-mRNA cleavage complex II protein Clp1 [Cordyceps fumosorosea ARSEF 2679]OAA56103.1 pre-mRNA cleavage complex II protein Clp1 [Cordyceps fumosorosea ARSEF 2679]
MKPTRIRGYGELHPCKYTVAGHAGPMCDPDGEIFIKPCTQAEINFYAKTRGTTFANIMPTCMGTLLLSTPSDLKIDDAVTGVITDAGAIQTAKEQIEAVIAEQVLRAPAEGPTPNEPPYVPSNGGEIETDLALVLENATKGFVKANILDVKLGQRLYADDATAEKQLRFQELTKKTTHQNLGFRIAGMRVYRGSDDRGILQEDSYRVYARDYGRCDMKDDNIHDGFRSFVHNEAAGIDEELAKAVYQGFAQVVKTIQETLEAHETVMYSSSLLFVFEGDGKALRAAIERNNEMVTAIETAVEAKEANRTTQRTDSGIAMGDDELTEAAVLGDGHDEDEGIDLDIEAPRVLSVKLIDFAHARFNKGGGCDENLLMGVRSHVESSTRIVALRKAGEWRFHLAPGTTISVKLVSGTAEKDGVELAPRSAYKFAGPLRGKLLTWHGCELEVDGRTDSDSIAAFPAPTNNPAASYVNLHGRLAALRATAAASTREGPRVLVAGGRATGKTTLVRTLASYATRQGRQPLVVNADPGEGALSLAGTLSAGVFATVMDPLAADGWGGTPTSGPSAVPVKLPLVYYYGRESAEADPDVYKRLFGRLADGVSARLSEDPDVKASGVLVDSMGVEAGSARGLDLLAHMVDELSVNIVIVLGTSGLNGEIASRFATEKTSLGEPIQVITLDKSDGVVDREESFTEHCREAVIKEYFFGDVRRTLSPQIQQVDFDSLVIYRLPDYSDYETETLVREEVCSSMEHWTLAVMHASVRDSPETIRTASVMGFVYVADVDEQKRKVKMLAPVSGRLGDRPLVWGRWPEPFINLLG